MQNFSLHDILVHFDHIMLSMYPIRNDINNAVLTAPRAMPMKDSTSDGTSTFAMGRRDFTQSLVTDTANTSQNPQKKWIGGNRDASQIVNKRRVQSIAVGSLNSNGPAQIGFTSKTDQNTQRDALHRVRSGGAAVPAKCTHKYPNSPVFY